MRGLRFLVKCELDRAGPSEDGSEALRLLNEEIEMDDTEAGIAFVRPPEEKPPVIEGREKPDEDDDEDSADS